MIVREIKDCPEKILSCFDFFNDYKDTRKWCVSNFPEVLPLLDRGYELFVAEWQKGFITANQIKNPPRNGLDNLM